jgi:glutamate 5-kinase
MSAIVDQIAELHRMGVKVTLISSGAVASGRSELRGINSTQLNAVACRQLYSAVGQAKLINRYYELFREHGIACGQVLTTKENFATRRHYLNQKNCMEVMLANDVIPIVNENDTVSVTACLPVTRRWKRHDSSRTSRVTMMPRDSFVRQSHRWGVVV